MEDALGYLFEKRRLQEPLWAIVRREDGAYLGTISATIDRPNRIADLGILIGARGCSRQGYGGEAWCSAMRYLIESGMRKIEAGAMETNTAMIRIFETSMRIEGRRPAHFWDGRRTVDLILAGYLSDRI